MKTGTKGVGVTFERKHLSRKRATCSDLVNVVLKFMDP